MRSRNNFRQKLLYFFLSLIIFSNASAQANFSFDFAGAGQRVCPADAVVTLSPPSATIRFLDAAANTTQATNVYRRHLYGTGADWVQIASNLPAGTASYIDNNVAAGDVWEYQIKRTHGAAFSTGYTTAVIGYDQSNYRGRMILLIADNIASGLSARVTELKKDLTGDGWLVQQLTVPKAYGWDSGDTVVGIRTQIQNIYSSAPANDKPKQLFILGHVPLPRAGLGGQTPDDHMQNAGARGADTYYADVDGVYTDAGTYNPGGLSSPYAVNVPGDFKWDQDNIPSELEMAFGRIDFRDIASYANTELALTDQYLARLHHYKQADAGFYMGSKTGFFFGYDNSNDGSYRSLPPMSGAANVYQNTTALPHPQWVRQNGPFMMYMQNREAPQIGEWTTYGMDAAIYTSDQSYWGFGDVPEGNQYSKIRSILGVDSKCVMVIWTTMAINLFHQAGAGEPIGLACKQIMDHNTTNQKLEKPSSPYDAPAFWNRTQFELYGDPSIRLMQVVPATNPAISAGTGNSVTLSWLASSDNNIVGYNIYRSSSEFGKYDRISGSTPVGSLTFTDANSPTGSWYMIRAIKQQQSGSGIFFNPSQGIFIQNTFVVPVRLNNFTAVKKDKFALLQWNTESEQGSIGFFVQRSADAAQWKDISFVNTKALNGSSSNTLSYSFTDASPLPNENYYRLKFVSANEPAAFSDTKKLLFGEASPFIIAPNPVRDWLSIQSISGEEISFITIYDQAGRIAYQSKKGKLKINLSSLPAGAYVIQITAIGGKIYRQQIIKQ